MTPFWVLEPTLNNWIRNFWLLWIPHAKHFREPIATVAVLKSPSSAARLQIRYLFADHPN